MLQSLFMALVKWIKLIKKQDLVWKLVFKNNFMFSGFENMFDNFLMENSLLRISSKNKVFFKMYFNCFLFLWFILKIIIQI